MNYSHKSPRFFYKIMFAREREVRRRSAPCERIGLVMFSLKRFFVRNAQIRLYILIIAIYHIALHSSTNRSNEVTK